MDSQEMLTRRQQKDLKERLGAEVELREVRLAARIGELAASPKKACEIALQLERELVARVERLRSLPDGEYNGVTIASSRFTFRQNVTMSNRSKELEHEYTLITLRNGVMLELKKSYEVPVVRSNRPVEYSLDVVEATGGAAGRFTDHTLDEVFPVSENYPYTLDNEGYAAYAIHGLFEFDESFAVIEAELGEVLLLTTTNSQSV